MKKFDYTIQDNCGIHARPAGMLVKEAGKFESKITIWKEDRFVDVSKLIALMGLGVKKGDTVTVEIDGSDEEKAAEALEKFFKENL